MDFASFVCWTVAHIMWIIASYRQKRYVGVPFEALVANCFNECFFGLIFPKHISFHQAFFNFVWFSFDVYQFAAYFHYNILPSVKILFSKKADSRKKSEALGVVTYFVTVIFFMLGVIVSWMIGWGDRKGEYNAWFGQIMMSTLFLRRLVLNPSTGADTFGVVIPGILRFIGTLIVGIEDFYLVKFNSFLFGMIIGSTFLDVTCIIFSLIFNKIYSDNSEKPAINKERKQLKNEGDCEYVPLEQ